MKVCTPSAWVPTRKPVLSAAREVVPLLRTREVAADGETVDVTGGQRERAVAKRQGAIGGACAFGLGPEQLGGTRVDLAEVDDAAQRDELRSGGLGAEEQNLGVVEACDADVVGIGDAERALGGADQQARAVAAERVAGTGGVPGPIGRVRTFAEGEQPAPIGGEEQPRPRIGGSDQAGLVEQASRGDRRQDRFLAGRGQQAVTGEPQAVALEAEPARKHAFGHGFEAVLSPALWRLPREEDERLRGIIASDELIHRRGGKLPSGAIGRREPEAGWAGEQPAFGHGSRGQDLALDARQRGEHGVVHETGAAAAGGENPAMRGDNELNGASVRRRDDGPASAGHAECKTALETDGEPVVRQASERPDRLSAQRLGQGDRHRERRELQPSNGRIAQTSQPQNHPDPCGAAHREWGENISRRSGTGNRFLGAP
ncbi:MAG: hypothetical protein QM691_07325 [Opitutaceae bacterium]